MCGGAVGLAGTLGRSMPRRRESFYKRHPERRHKPSKNRKRVKVKFTPREDQKLIYYSETQALPTGVHHKILYTVMIVAGLPLFAMAAIHFWEIMICLLFLGLFFVVWGGALCYMAYQHWHKEPNPYRRPKDPVDVQTW